jgi:hypothetical protein
MSGSITFQRGPFQGWHLALHAVYAADELARLTVQVEPPASDDPRGGLLSFSPGIPGFEQAVTAENGGPAEMADLLEWIIEGTRTALAERTDIDPGQREFWTGIIDRADQTRADFFARYPDGKVPPFETVARLLFDGTRLLAQA